MRRGRYRKTFVAKRDSVLRLLTTVTVLHVKVKYNQSTISLYVLTHHTPCLAKTCVQRRAKVRQPPGKYKRINSCTERGKGQSNFDVPPKHGEVGETTAGKIAIGAQHSNDATTTMATALADLFQNGNFWHSGGYREAIALASRLATRYIATWKEMMRIVRTAI